MIHLHPHHSSIATLARFGVQFVSLNYEVEKQRIKYDTIQVIQQDGKSLSKESNNHVHYRCNICISLLIIIASVNLTFIFLLFYPHFLLRFLKLEDADKNSTSLSLCGNSFSTNSTTNSSLLATPQLWDIKNPKKVSCSHFTSFHLIYFIFMGKIENYLKF